MLRCLTLSLMLCAAGATAPLHAQDGPSEAAIRAIVAEQVDFLHKPKTDQED